jgi:hypothetical protein
MSRCNECGWDGIDNCKACQGNRSDEITDRLRKILSEEEQRIKG